MKKILFGTTALAALGLVLAAAPAVAQAPATGFKSTNFDFTVGGYARQFVTTAGNQGGLTQTAAGALTSTAVQTFDQQSDLRLVIGAATTMANGIRVGQALHWDALANETGASSSVRRNWSFLSGGFGELRLGSTDAVTQTMFVGAPDAFGGPGSVNDGKIYDNILSGTKTQTAAGSDSTFTTSIRLFDRSANKIQYYTPRFEGFQLGLNYTPDATQNRNTLAVSDISYRNGKAIAVNYTNTIAGVAVQAYGGYLTWDAPRTSTLSANIVKDPDAYGAGLQLGYMGFGLGGSWATIRDGIAITRGNAAVAPTVPAATITIDGDAYEAGASYTFGPAMVSINYLHGTNEAANYATNTGVKTLNSREEKREVFALNGQYTLAPGVIVMASGYYAKHEANTAVGGNQSQLSPKAGGAIGALILNF
jgi:hypothetical protein